MPDSNADKLLLELAACSRCKNPFMMNKGEKLRKQENNEEIVCENCIKLITLATEEKLKCAP